jgi:transketolase
VSSVADIIEESGRQTDLGRLARAIRRHAVMMTNKGGSSHVGSVLSMADILAVLYGNILTLDPSKPDWDGRDRFILSKGHAGAGVYAALAETGFFDIEYLDQHCADGSRLSGHVSHKGVPGVEFSTGSLGHGLGVGAGMAYAAHLDGKSHRVFTVLSDGECDEGSVWEAAMFAAHHKLDQLVAIIDYNKIQSLGSVSETLGLALKSLPFTDGKPSCLIAHTVKGKGVSFMENSVLWHYRSPQGEEYERALQELSDDDA